MIYLTSTGVLITVSYEDAKRKLNIRPVKILAGPEIPPKVTVIKAEPYEADLNKYKIIKI